MSWLHVSCVLLSLAVLSNAELKYKAIPQYVQPANPSSRTLAVFPSNIHAIVGDTVILTCVALEPPPASRINWYEFVTMGEFNPQLISDNNFIVPSHPNSARYTVIQESPTMFSLQIRNVTLADGGTYVCLNANSGPPFAYRGQAELITLASNPTCGTTVADDGVVLESTNYTKSCIIYYQGGLTPQFYWEGPEPYFVVTTPTESDVFTGLIFTADRGMDMRFFRCTCNFTAPIGSPSGVAGNAPLYTSIRQYTQMLVFWGPKNMYSVPSRPSFEVGDLITCYADAYPDPFYLWQNMRTLEFYYTQIYTVNADDVGFQTLLRCQAQNLIQGFLHTQQHFTEINVPAPTTPTTPTTPSTPPTPAPEADCDDLTGWWLSYSPNPYAELYLMVDQFGQTGRVTGFMRNHTDQQWVEVVGRTRTSDFAFLGLTSIWPYEMGVTGMSAECHQCYGVEVIMTVGNWRSSSDSLFCGHGGTPTTHTGYEFFRVGGIGNKIHQPDFKVYKPTKQISGAFGIKHLQY